MNSDCHRPIPLLIAWEVTRRCHMNCQHCRAAAENFRYPNELNTEQCLKILENISGFAKPIIILTGGEPMLREDIYQISRYGAELGLRMVMAPCGYLMNDQTTPKLIESGIQCISISLDGPNAEIHDALRRVPGAFDTALRAIGYARKYNLPFQINTTITKLNQDYIDEMLNLAVGLGAITYNPFLLVPTGRGSEMADQELSPDEYEAALQWLSDRQDSAEIAIRVTCAPHYQRIIRQKRHQNVTVKRMHSETNRHHPSGGCMGGKSFAFISHVGTVQICGFLDIPAGNLIDEGLDFERIWFQSEYLNEIRNTEGYKGKCGYCEYRKVCGGCRARAFATTGNVLASEPYCIYQPEQNNR